MKIKKVLSLLFTVLLLFSLLSACSGASEMAAGSMGADKNTGALEDAADSRLSKTESTSTSAVQTDQKLIRKVYMDAETEDMDSLLVQVEQRIGELEGYIENREVYNGSSRYTRSRYANLTVRIPADKLDQFVEQVAEVSNITSLRENTEDVTLSYVATESRIRALETEETRLLELLAQAENMEDLLTIEARLTDVRTELEQVKTQLQIYDNKISYGTIYLTVNEVREYTDVEEPEGFFARIGKGFVNSARGLWKGVLEIVIFLISNLPYIAAIALVITGIVLPVKIRKKKKNKETKE